MSPFRNHILGFLYVEIAKIAVLPLAHECRQQPLKKINPTTHKRPAKINPRIAARPLDELIWPLWAESKGFQYIP